MLEFIQQLINGLSSGAIYALIAVGYTMVYGVLRLINFAHGDIYMVGAMAGLYILARRPVLSAQPTWDAGTVLIGLLLAMEIAYHSVRLVARLLRARVGCAPRTLGTAKGARSAAYALLSPALGVAVAVTLLVLCPRVRFEPVQRAPSWLALLGTLGAAMVICGYLGYRIERIAYRPLRNQPRIASLITAIGVSLFLEFGGQQVFGPTPQGFPDLPFAGPSIDWGGILISRDDLLVFAAAVLIMGLLWWVVMKTRTGMALRAVSWRFDTAALMGIDIDRIVSFTFVLGSALAAVAGVLVAYRSHQVDPLMGLIPGIKAFIAAVLGGIGNIPGALLGGLLLGVTEVMVAAYFPSGSQYRDGVAFVILIGVLLVKPSGLMGSNVVEKV